MPDEWPDRTVRVYIMHFTDGSTATAHATRDFVGAMFENGFAFTADGICANMHNVTYMEEVSA